MHEGYVLQSRRQEALRAVLPNCHRSCVPGILTTAEGTTASYPCKGDELYVRARIISSKPKAEAPTPGETEQAWTQPVVTGR